MFPGLTRVYTTIDQAFATINQEHKSRSQLYQVFFRVFLDTTEGKPNQINPQEQWGTIFTSVSLEKMFENQPEYRGQGIVNRLAAKVESYEEVNSRIGTAMHYFTVR